MLISSEGPQDEGADMKRVLSGHKPFSQLVCRSIHGQVSTNGGTQWQRFLAVAGQVTLLFNKNQVVAYKYHILFSNQVISGSETIR